MKKTTISIKNESDKSVVYVEGSIDEYFGEYCKEIKEIKQSNIVFNFEHLTFINSVGIRHWVEFLGEFEKKREIIFEECSPVVVNQINMLPEFQSNSKIVSIFGEFLCEDCGFTKNEKFLTEAGYDTLVSQMANRACQSCDGGEMQLCDFPESFLSFMADKP